MNSRAENSEMNEKEENILAGCQRCGGPVIIGKISCPHCRISIDLPLDNDFLPKLATLSSRDLAFVRLFLEYDGSIKALAESLEISMPTVKKRLNEIKKSLRGM